MKAASSGPQGGAGAGGPASGSDGANLTNAGWSIYPITSSTQSQPFGVVSATSSYDPNNTLVAGTLAMSGQFCMMKLQNPNTGNHPNTAYVVQHDLRGIYGTGLTGGTFSPQKIVNAMIQLPAGTPLPSGTFAFAFLSDQHLSASNVKGFGPVVANETGTGMRVKDDKSAAGTFVTVTATTDSVGLRAGLYHISFANSTQQKGADVVPLDSTGAQIGAATNMAVDTVTSANASGIQYLNIGFGWISGTVGQTASVTASFKALVSDPFGIRCGSLDG